ncbi:hypothetical protein [Halorhodospira halochloris]|uniref:hypothetical protein n=1 Tax=Halorhodospira halochloris TaxID=1052 RepID=UPI001EE80CB7|nr:hypothetical protein [Halorhodospira halochloris]MCG5547233.1 hypothetical protein [Halorhodospira halochloris]
MSLHYSETPVGCRWVSGSQGKPPIIQSLASICQHCFVVLLIGVLGYGQAVLAEPIDEGEIWRGQHHQAEQTACKLISDEQKWQEIWQQVGESPPQDWSDGARAIAALDQQRPSGGYTLQLRAFDDKRLVVESRPPEGPASSVMTRPWLIVLFVEGGIESVACSFPE